MARPPEVMDGEENAAEEGGCGDAGSAGAERTTLREAEKAAAMLLTEAAIKLLQHFSSRSWT